MGERRRAFDHKELALFTGEALAESHQEVSEDRLPVEELEVKDDGSLRVLMYGRNWLYDAASGDWSEGGRPAREAEPRPEPEGRRRGPRLDGRPPRSRDVDSPDGRWSAFIQDHNVFLRDKMKNETFQLSTEGNQFDGYEPRLMWSPDSSRLLAFRKAEGDDRRVHLIESSPPDVLQPRLSDYAYRKPGDRIPITRPHLFDLKNRAEIPVDNALFPQPWSLEEFRWDCNSDRFTFLYHQRGHQVRRWLSVDAKTGEVSPIVDEQSETFIDYAFKTYSKYVEESSELIWMSERDGWNHLYLIDAESGAVKYPITKGEWVVRGVDRVDEDNRQVWFHAGGIHPDQDPYHVHYARVNFDGSGLTLLTEGDGTHQVQFSPDNRYYIDTYSRVDLPPVTELRRSDDGSLVLELERADWSALLATGWQPPERFCARGRDGETNIYGVIYRPTSFDADAHYPVIEHIYAGPHDAHVPKAFSAHRREQDMAELGFILVQIDGMGTNWRSKAFHDVCWKNLADAGFPDRIAWIKAAAETRPYLDLSRVGIYGGSAGGQNALGALLFHPEFYKAAAADCGCHDNRMDKIWWNEAWMGWPIGPHYADQSNVTNAHKLQGKLLLTVGELDHNVDPSSTMQVVDALIKADKDFELIVFPGADHGAGESPYGVRRRNDFFVRHLLGKPCDE